MTTRTHTVAAALSAVLLIAALASASANTPDRAWIRKAISANILEVRAGNLAAQRDTSAVWQRFGDRMVRDHTRALGQLRMLARDKRIAYPSRMSPADQATFDMLARRRGRSFDAAYRRFALQSHVQANRLYETEIARGRDSDVRAVAAKQLPVVQNHLTMVDHMLGVSTRNLTDYSGA